jgi:2-polyprenyl-6-methoxyphenol hydroxylase-like FAD-dependent oxidoreductase
VAEPVVISGAGPNGLLLACELALGGVRAIVLDGLPGPSDEAKANGLVGQVIRQLDMRGLYRRFSGASEPPRPSFGWMFAGLSLSLLEVEDNPMYSLLIQQPKLVRFLDDRARELGVDVRWGHELTAFTSDDAGATLIVSSPDGDYDLRTDWLVAADGGRSMIRKSLGIDFPGHTSPIVSRVAHVHLPEELLVPGRGYEVPGYGLIPFGHSRHATGNMILFPVDPDRPLLGTIEYDPIPGDGPMTLDELRASVRRLTGADLPFDAPRKDGVHALRRIDELNSRLAERYRAGRVLLVGDAAHVHSPMGGPGLNLGMQDAINLGWKLAAVVTGRASEDLLDTYESERRPVGERVMMHSMAQLALAAPGPEIDALRAVFEELVAGPAAATQLARLLAGSDVRYDVGDAHPLAGYMVPDLVFDDGRRVAELLHAARPILLDFTGELRWTDGRVDLVPARMADRPAAALLIRPDGYVAWAADDLAATAVDNLHTAVNRWCGAVSELSSP